MSKILDFLNKYFKYLIAATIVIVPLYPKFPFISIPGTYVSIRIEDFLMVIIAIFALVRIIPNIKTIFKDGIIRAMAVFLLVGAVSLVSGVLLTQTVLPSIGILHLLRRVEYFMPFIAVFVFSSYDKGKNIDFYIKTLMLTVSGIFVYGIGQIYLNFPVILTQNSESSKGAALSWIPGSQLASTFAGHYDLAAYMVLVLPVLITLIFTVKGKVSRILLTIVSLFGFWLLANTASRISLASYLFAVCIALILAKKIKALIAVLIISLVLSVFATNLFNRYKNLIDVYLQKIVHVKIVDAKPFNMTVFAESVDSIPFIPTPTPVPIVEDRSTNIRLAQEWPRAIRAFSKNPLIGTGYSSVGLAIDNDYLRLLAEVGFLGFLAFMLVIIRILLVFVYALPLTKKLAGVELGFVAGVIGGIMGVLANAMFIDVFEASKFAITFWLFVGLAVYTVKNANNDYKN